MGTANYWVVIPLVFCENRNINVLRQAFEDELGFAKHDDYKSYVHQIVELYREGKTQGIKSFPLTTEKDNRKSRLFKNIDGIKFLTHEGGCGGTRQDSEALCALLAGYINNPKCCWCNRTKSWLPKCAGRYSDEANLRDINPHSPNP